MLNFDWYLFVDDLMRIGAAAIIGGALGLERELSGHSAGLRTHMMVSIGCAVFVVAGLAICGERTESVTRVVQGIAAGIGFLGAGTILKLDEKEKIKGLTTASSIWLASALGTLAGLAEYVPAAAATVIALLVLAVLRPIERLLGHHTNGAPTDDASVHSKNPPNSG
jgi:putative Mg2+ transporter-C (MgtC) family protein